MQEGIPIPELRHSTMDSAIGIASYNTFEIRSLNARYALLPESNSSPAVAVGVLDVGEGY